MTVSVLIPAHDETDVLGECLDSIAAQTRPVEQVIVVCDRSPWETVALALERGAVVRLADEGAKAAAQNMGLPHVAGDYLICVDADTVLAPDVVERFLATLEGGVDATCANMLPMPSQRGFWVAHRRFAYALGRYWWRWCQDKVGRLMVLSGCAYAVRTATIRELGGFPGGLITCDMDLTWELHSRGYKVSFCHHALAYTYDPETFRVYKAQMRRWASGFFQNFARHRRTAASSPRSILVVGTLLYDLLILPVSYSLGVVFLVRNPNAAHWVWRWAIVHAAATITVASRTIGWRRAVLSYIPYWTVNWFNKSLYLWTLVREWVLGRHYASWTGRQGRKTVVTKMTRRRRFALAAMGAMAAAVVGAVRWF